MADGSSKSHGCKKRGVLKRGKDTSLLDRWQNDELHRASQLVHGWTDEWVKYLDYISQIDISHDAPYRQRLLHESTIYMRCVDSNKQAGPLCQRPDYKSSANALVSLQRAQGKGVPQIPMHLRTRQTNNVEFQLEDVFLVIFILNMDRKPNVILGPSMARMALSRVARQRMVESTITTTTPEPRTDQYKETGTGRSERKGLNCFQVHLNPDSICGLLRTSQIFCSFWQFRVQSGNCHERAGVCVQTNASPYAHTRTFSRCARVRTPDVSTRLAQGLDDMFVCLKSHFIIGHVFVQCSFDPVPAYFLLIYCLIDATYCLTDATDRNQIKPLCNPALGWTVWPSGRSDPKHRLWAQVLLRC